LWVVFAVVCVVACGSSGAPAPGGSGVRAGGASAWSQGDIGIASHGGGVTSGGSEGSTGFPPTNGSGDLVYHNGPVERTSHNFVIYWQPAGTFMSATYQTLINRFFTDIGGSYYYNIATQYSDTTGPIANQSTLGGAWVDPTPYPSANLTNQDVVSSVERAIAANAWPTAVGNNFFVFLARGECACSKLNHCDCGGGFCAWHNWDPDQSGNPLLIATMPYAEGELPTGTCSITRFYRTPSPNGDPDADDEISIVAHELMEMVTDPYTDVPPTGINGGGWFDTVVDEIGDKCQWNPAVHPAPDGSDLTMNGHPYIAQPEYSNATRDCELSYVFLVGNAPSSLSMGKSATANVTVTVTDVSSFSGTVNLTVTGVPARTTATLSPTTVTPTSQGAQSTLTIQTMNTQHGTYTLVVTATDGGFSQSANVTLTVK
jgi:hypothetical protein